MLNVSGAGKIVEVGDLRTVGDGKQVCNIRLQCKVRGKLEWATVVCWGKQAEFVSTYLKEGDFITVEGAWQTRKWQDKDGHTRYSTEVVASSVQGIGGKGGLVEDAVGEEKPF
jgi:single stranded DNA-binding protein